VLGTKIISFDEIKTIVWYPVTLLDWRYSPNNNHVLLRHWGSWERRNYLYEQYEIMYYAKVFLASYILCDKKQYEIIISRQFLITSDNKQEIEEIYKYIVLNFDNVMSDLRGMRRNKEISIERYAR
jgi:hypothetical protein